MANAAIAEAWRAVHHARRINLEFRQVTHHPAAHRAEGEAAETVSGRRRAHNLRSSTNAGIRLDRTGPDRRVVLVALDFSLIH